MAITLKYFTASYCSACRAIKPTIDDLVNQGKIALLTCDLEQDNSCAPEMEVDGYSAIPYFKLYLEGALMEQGEGWSADELRNKVDALNIIGDSPGNSGGGSDDIGIGDEIDYTDYDNNTGNGSENTGSNGTRKPKYWLFVGIALGLLLAGTVVYFIIKRKKMQA